LEGFDRYRSEFPITKTHIFMNHAAISPPPARVVRAVERLFREFSNHGIDCNPHWMKRVEEVRHLFAMLIHAEPSEIAFVGSTSEGLGIIATGLNWKNGDVVLIPVPEFPANVYPWMNLERRGVKVRFVKRKNGRFTTEDLDKALLPEAKLLSVSSVDFATGYRCDLEALGDFCRRKGLLLCVDAIQSLGVIPIDVKRFGIHFLTADGHKWLLSTMGCGGLFISKEVNHQIHPDRVGWKSVINEEDFFRLHFELKPDAQRFEPGTMNVAGIYALGAAIELLLEVEVEKIYPYVLALCNQLFEGLKDRDMKIVTPMGEEERSGILSFIPPSDPKSLYHFMTENKITLSLREDMIRLSPHFYNNKDDIDSFFKCLDRFLALTPQDLEA
jgi:cysteine desulfurase/selenocysteine lyase